MTDIVIVRHVAHEGPGHLAEFLDRHGLTYRLIRIDAGEPLPDSLAGFGALVSMGGPMSANDALPWIEQEIHLMRQAFDADLPVLGHCLGGQLMARVLGAKITANSVREFGWHPIRCDRNHDTGKWLVALPDEFDAFHWHGETFSLPPETDRLFHNQWCEQQGFAFGNSLGLQCHIEMTQSMIDDWVGRADANELDGGNSTPSGDTILRQTPVKLPEMQYVAEILYGRWVQGINA